MSPTLGDIVVVEHYHGNDNAPTAALVTGVGETGSIDCTVFPRGVTVAPANLVNVPPSSAVDETYLRYHGKGTPDDYRGSTPPAPAETVAPATS
ncbi:MAG TPA: hypothetical protein VGG32_08540 [Thermoplasmata archaeon]|jgi:hypothetical protein